MTAALNDDARELCGIHSRSAWAWLQDGPRSAAFLASDKAGYITGQVLAVNGGMYC